MVCTGVFCLSYMSIKHVEEVCRSLVGVSFGAHRSLFIEHLLLWYAQVSFRLSHMSNKHVLEVCRSVVGVSFGTHRSLFIERAFFWYIYVYLFSTNVCVQYL